MEEQRQRDLRVPLVSGLFFVSSITGGILLIMWLFEINGSRPWFPIVALMLISFPWVFWLITYVYTLMKTCFRRDGGRVRRDVSRKPQVAALNRALSSKRDSGAEETGKRQVQFGAVVVMDNGGDSSQECCDDGSAADVSVASSKECEMPLTLAVSS